MPETDRLISVLTGMMVVALALLVGFGHESLVRSKSVAAIDVCSLSPVIYDASQRVCRVGNSACALPTTDANSWQDCVGAKPAVRVAEAEPFNFKMILQMLRIDSE
jgi:hypothetical protein